MCLILLELDPGLKHLDILVLRQYLDIFVLLSIENILIQQHTTFIDPKKCRIQYAVVFVILKQDKHLILSLVCI